MLRPFCFCNHDRTGARAKGALNAATRRKTQTPTQQAANIAAPRSNVACALPAALAAKPPIHGASTMIR